MSPSEALDTAENATIFSLVVALIMGLFKMITSLGMRSKCGVFDFDLRNKETKQLEIEKCNELEMRKMELQERELEIRRLEVESRYSEPVKLSIPVIVPSE